MTRTKPKPAARASRKPRQKSEPAAAPQEPPQAPSRFDAYKAEAPTVRAHCPRFAGLSDMDMIFVLALVDLLGYGGHCRGCINDTPNWLGGLLEDILLLVVHHGPEYANAKPELVKHEYESAMEDLRENLELCHRKIAPRLPESVLREMESWQSPASAKAASA